MQLLDLVKQNKDRFEIFFVDEMAESTNRKKSTNALCILYRLRHRITVSPTQLNLFGLKRRATWQQITKAIEIMKIQLICYKELQWIAKNSHRVSIMFETKMYRVDNYVKNMLEQFIIHVSVESLSEGSDDDSL